MGRAILYSQEMISRYMGEGYWDATTFADVWDQNAEKYPDREAVVDEGQRLTWREAKEWTDGFARGLVELGLQKDEILILHLPNCAELILIRIACEKAGVLSLPVPWALRHKEIDYIANKTGAAGIVIPRAFYKFDYLKMIEDLRPKLPELKHVFVVGDPAPSGTISVKKLADAGGKGGADLTSRRFKSTEYSWVQLTGGSTGFPKFVEAPICGRVYSGRVFAEACRMSAADVCGMYAVGPVGPNIFSSICAPLVGAKIVMLERFVAEEALRLIEKERITVVGLVPTMLAMMLEHPEFPRFDLRSLRVVISTGAPLPSGLAEEAERKMGPLVQFLGSVDFGAITVPYLDASRETRLFTVNRPLPGGEIRFLDERGQETAAGEVGEIVLRGPGCNGGFYRDPEITWQVWSKDGWFRTGDLGRLDEAGNLVIAGRKKDVIIRGGQNIFPGEIESILLLHPAVSGAAVVGMPDAIMGEKACAFVVPAKGQDFGFEDMIAFLKEKSIATYKLPERLEILEQLPLLPGSGKVDKQELSRRLSGKQDGR